MGGCLEGVGGCLEGVSGCLEGVGGWWKSRCSGLTSGGRHTYRTFQRSCLSSLSPETRLDLSPRIRTSHRTAKYH